MAREPEFVLNFLKQVEQLAQEVLSDRRDIIELSKKRDKAREAMRAVRKMEENDDEPVWYCAGNMFMSMQRQEAIKVLDKDFNKYDKEISRLQRGLKDKVKKLYDAESKPELKGYDLIPISSEEKKSLFELIEN